MEHTTENSLPEEIRNPQGEFLWVDLVIPNALPNCEFFLAGLWATKVYFTQGSSVPCQEILEIVIF